jgi:hypothetical protein
VRKAVLPRWLRLPAVLVAVVVALLAPLLQPGAAEAAPPLPGGAFYANISNAVWQSCVNVRHDSTQAGAWIQEYPCDGTGASDFYFAPVGTSGYYEIIGEHSNLCITPNGSSLPAGTPLVQWYCVGAQSQLWQLVPYPTVDGTYEIHNPATGMCLTFPDGNAWTILQIQPCDDVHRYQTFHLDNILPA